VLLNYHIGHFVLGSLCVGDLVRLGLSSVHVAGFSLRKLLMMDILTSETCRVHKYVNYYNDARSNKHKKQWHIVIVVADTIYFVQSAIFVCIDG